jgi:hypothetical protein
VIRFGSMDPTGLIVLAGLGILAARLVGQQRRPEAHRVASTRLGATPRGALDPSIPAFPENIAERDAFILDQVKQGLAEIRWAPLRSSYKGHTAEFRVFADAMKIGGIRVNLTAAGQQRVADALGCMLLTLQLADLLWSQRQVELKPVEMSQTEHDLAVMKTVERMVLHSQKIDAMIAALPQPPEGIVCTVGKHWVINDALGKTAALKQKLAMNYGWNNRGQGPKCATPAGVLPPGGPPCNVVQDPGTVHNIAHTDYSQTCTLVDAMCTVDGQRMPLATVLQDPVLSFLASSTGRMTVLRQPGVT